MRAGGAGGQHVNKTESAVRIWYRKGTPDEMEVKCQDGRSQGRTTSRRCGFCVRVYTSGSRNGFTASVRTCARPQVGSGERGAKIRTYHFKENRCTDHRIGLTVHKLDTIMAGDLDLMIGPMREHVKKEKLAAVKAG